MTWKRIGKEMPVRHRLESFGQQLTIDDVQYEDAGKYECQGINDMTMVPVRRSMDLSVECKYGQTDTDRQTERQIERQRDRE